MQIAIVVGTRPEAIKLAPVAELLGAEAMVVHTGQHFSDGMRGNLKPDVLLDSRNYVNIGGGHQLGGLVTALDRVLDQHKPHAVVVQGDTTSALAGALAANANRRLIVHVEAGLRSFDRTMPEEHNRVLIDHLADLCCAPTPLARANLLAEGVSLERIEVTGNTIVDAVAGALPDPEMQIHILGQFGVTPGGYVLATIHRPENADDPANLAAILRQLDRPDVPVLFPLHPRTRRRIATFGLSDLASRLRLTGPLDYPVLLTLIRHAMGLVTDSGGVQEEATILKRSILVVRRSNERPEAEESFGGRALPVGDEISETIRTWLREGTAINARLAELPTPYGDGTASSRVVHALRSRLTGSAGRD